MPIVGKYSNREKITYPALLFSFLVAFAEWLSSYRSIREGISLADFLFVILLVYFLIDSFHNQRKISVIYLLPLSFLLFILLTSLINATLINDFNYLAVFTRFAKFSFFWVIIVLLFPKYLSKDVFYKALKITVWISCLGLLIQYVVYLSFGSYVDIKLPFLSYANDVIESIDFELIRAREFRPDSIFLESAHLAVFLSTYLAILLLDKKESSKKILKAIAISVFMLMTTSSTALFLLFIIWTFYYLQIFFQSKNKVKLIKNLFVGLIVLTIFIPVFINIPQLYQAFDRIRDLDGVAVTGRLNAGDVLVSNLSGIHKWIGVGFGNFNEYQYLNGINYLKYTTGYLGLLFYFIVVLIPFFKTDYLGKAMIIVFIVLSFSRPNVISINIIVTSAVVYLGYREKKKYRALKQH